MIRIITLEPEQIDDKGGSWIRITIEGGPTELLLAKPLPTWNVRRLKIAIWETVFEEARSTPWRVDYGRVASMSLRGQTIDDDVTLEQLGFFDSKRWRAVVGNVIKT